MSSVVVLSPEQLQALVRDAVRDGIAEAIELNPAAKTLSEEDVVRARKNLRRFGRGR